MDKSEIFKQEIHIGPCEDGSFVLTSHANAGFLGVRGAFSNIHDLLSFLHESAPRSASEIAMEELLTASTRGAN